MPYQRDVQAFDARAAGYDGGRMGQLHRDICDRVAGLALAGGFAPRRVLDVGSGTGYLVGVLARRLPGAAELTGVDAAGAMVAVARERAAQAGADSGAGDGAGAGADSRVRFVTGAAERLPAPDGHYDLVVSTTSFDHWADQAAGLAECARVLAPGGRLVLADLFSVLLWPTLVGSRRGKARTRARASRLLAGAGLRSPQWHRLQAGVLQAVTAVR